MPTIVKTMEALPDLEGKTKLIKKGKEVQEIQIGRFDPSACIPPTKDEISGKSPSKGGVKVLVIGAPGSGKTHFIQWLLLSKAHLIPTAVVMSGTEAETGFYGRFIPPSYVYTEYDNDVVENFCAVQKKMSSSLGGRQKWAALVLDDFAAEIKNMNKTVSDTHTRLLKNGRHHNMLYILGVQDVYDVPADKRTSFDFIVLFNITNKQRLHSAMSLFAGVFPSEDIGIQVFNEITMSKYNAMIMRNNEGDLEKALYWGRAPANLPETTFGSVEYRSYGKYVLDKEKFMDDGGSAYYLNKNKTKTIPNNGFISSEEDTDDEQQAAKQN